MDVFTEEHRLTAAKWLLQRTNPDVVRRYLIPENQPTEGTDRSKVVLDYLMYCVKNQSMKEVLAKMVLRTVVCNKKRERESDKIEKTAAIMYEGQLNAVF